jgi:hypothetical protein
MQHLASPVGEGILMLGWPLVVKHEGLSLQECCRLLRKHLRLITLCFVGNLLLATPWMYTGKTTLLIERNMPQVLVFRDVLAGQCDSDAYDF